jgi:putative phosphoesterase
MRIAVIADTHGRLPAGAAERLRTADEIWHLGDFCDGATLEAVRSLGPPFYAVLGNNDWELDLPRTLHLERGGKTFRLIHIPPQRFGGADFLLHGHTHVPRDEKISGVRVLNPGSIGKADKGAPASWGWLTISDDGAVTWELERP